MNEATGPVDAGLAPTNDNDYHLFMNRHPTNDRPEPRTSERRTLKVRDLMRDDPVVELDHDGQIYRLRITRNRKLILTK